MIAEYPVPDARMQHPHSKILEGDLKIVNIPDIYESEKLKSMYENYVDNYLELNKKQTR